MSEQPDASEVAFALSKEADNPEHDAMMVEMLGDGVTVIRALQRENEALREALEFIADTAASGHMRAVARRALTTPDTE